jgi:hypothetical protein
MSAMYGPDGKAPTFNGSAWISQDGRYWWNGAAWQPLKARRRFQPPIALTLIIVSVLAVAWYVVQRIPQPPPPAVGVTNGTIDSSTQFEFDYRRTTTCNDLIFDYLFFDTSGHQVGKYQDQQHNKVLADKTYHFRIYAEFGATIDSHAVRFTATPTCLA